MKGLKNGLAALMVFLWAVWPGVLRAQEKTFHGWVVLNYEQKLGEKWAVVADAQLRSSAGWNDVAAALFRPSLQYNLSKKNSLSLGYAYMGNWMQEGDKEVFEKEHRAWQQFRNKIKLGSTDLINRTRLEQRFLEAENGYDFAQRLRVMVRFQIPLQQQQSGEKGWLLAVQNEYFANIQHKEKANGRFFDQNRSFAGLTYQFSKAFGLEAGYMYRYQIDATKMKQHIIQLSVNTNF